MGKKILVIGDTIIDENINLKVLGLSLESPTFKTQIIDKKSFFGGASNVAKYLCKFGVEVDFITCMSKESELKFKKKYSINIINLNHLIENKKSRFYIHRGDSSYKHLQINNVNSAVEIDFPKYFDLKKYDSIAISDYRCGVVTDEVVSTVENSNSKTFGACQLSDKESRLNKFINFDYIICNEIESKTILRRKNVIITKGNKGSELNGVSEDAFHVDNIKTTIGAGDCFYAAYLAYEDLKKANELSAKFIQGKI